MDYQRLYEELIQKARSENRVKARGGTYYEAHHIIPKCMGGEGKCRDWRTHPNIILLTAKEHFYAHYYLIKIHPNNPQLIYAFWSMCNQSRSKAVRDCSELEGFAQIYEEARLRFVEAQIGKPKGPRSEETRAKMSIAKKGRKLPPVSEETKAKISAAKKGKPKSEEHRAKLSSISRGVPKGPQSAETKAKRAATREQMNYKHSEETKAKLREVWRWRREGEKS